ncbi:MAG: GGDEF domain-containing protein [Chloroflexi bacterium]|nr:GGDEF domain-containing protein [Chloroflexota bacterium]
MARTPDFIDLLADADLLQLMLLNCPDGVVATDQDHKVVLYTGASEQLFGFEPIDVLHKDVSRLFADPLQYPEFLTLLDDNGRVVSLVMLAARKGGHAFSAAVSASRLSDRYGNTSGLVLYVRDHTNVQAIEAALRDNNERLQEAVGKLDHVARHDQMTGLLNRASAMEAARQAILAAGIQDRQFGVAVFDLDQFKAVNDSYGHLVGDEVLAALAAVLRATARHGDIVGRFGGEEFVAFLPGADLAAVVGFAERVRLAIEAAAVVVGGEVTVHTTVSAGAAAIPTCADNLREAIRVADNRLYLAKRSGRNRVVGVDIMEAGQEAA